MTARRRLRVNPLAYGIPGLVLLIALVLATPFVIYNFCRISVPAEHIAVLTRKTGIDMANNDELAASDKHKGIQSKVLTEGRYFKNPYHWEWDVYQMVTVPQGKLGVRIRLYGDDLGYGQFLAEGENQKGIIPEVLKPGLYKNLNAKVLEVDPEGVKTEVNFRPDQDYVEVVELHEPVTIPAGYKGVVTNLAGAFPETPNTLLVPRGNRGVQEWTLDEGTHYLNPYVYRVEQIDCRSQRFNLADGFDMGFPSKDGFWVSLDGIIEFRVKPEEAAKVYVLYNELNNDDGPATDIGQEIIRKVIMPNARAFCRLEGSNSSGRDFIGGETRSAFQEAFKNAILETCDVQGIEIVTAVITDIVPPKAIAAPISEREVARQNLKKFQQQTLQQIQEAKLATENALVLQKGKLVESEQEVVVLVTMANQLQEVAVAAANRDKEVADLQLAAAKDLAEAIMADKEAEAAVIRFKNIAEAAGWKNAVEAFNGDGQAYARYVMYQKLAPGFRSIMTNTADSPLMDVFNNFSNASSSE